MRGWRAVVAVGVCLVAGGATLTACGGGSAPSAGSVPHTGGRSHPGPPVLTTGSGPASAYDCTFNGSTDAFTGAYGTASAIGWEGNQQGVVTCLGGTFLVQNGLYRDYGFGLYDGAPTTWTDVDGYLPAQVTTFTRSGAVVSITEFADRIVVGGDAFVAVYSRVSVHNPTDRVVSADPGPTAGMVELDTAPDAVAPHTTSVHDYVVAADRFGHNYPWPSAAGLSKAGTFDQHLAHMRAFWNQQLAGIAAITVPDPSLEDAYRSDFISTQIARSGDDLHTGVNGYEAEYSHDVIGILANLFTEGYFSDAHALLTEARDVVGSQGQYVDGGWTYPWLWAVYLTRTGDRSFVKQNFDTAGPAGTAQPSIEDTAHEIAADRTGPGGIMESTDDIDFQGYWTTDDYEALLGLAGYRYLATSIGDSAEATWANQQYDSLLAATSQTLDTTISRYRLDYLPCSMLEPNGANTCANPQDANWASPFGRWAWDGSLVGAPLSGPGLSMIDATYTYGFHRLKGILPPDTFGGFPDDYYSSAYNAGEGNAGLAGSDYRDQGILSFQFMIEHSQSGPNSWWESSGPPSSKTPWTGSHPVEGQGSSPHAWGMAQANSVLLDSLVAQRSDGTLIVGRGVPRQWLHPDASESVSNFPAAGGKRLSLTITSTGRTASLSLSGQLPSGPILFQLPAFVDNITGSSTGTVDRKTGTVTLPPHTTHVTVTLARAVQE
jgi:hypothetical protein